MGDLKTSLSHCGDSVKGRCGDREASCSCN